MYSSRLHFCSALNSLVEYSVLPEKPAMSEPPKKKYRALHRIYVDVAVTFGLDDDYFIRMRCNASIRELIQEIRAREVHFGGYELRFQGCELQYENNLEYYDISQSFYKVPILHGLRVGSFAADDELLDATSIDAYEDELNECQ